MDENMAENMVFEKNVMINMTLLFAEVLNIMITDMMINSSIYSGTNNYVNTYHDYVNDFQSCNNRDHIIEKSLPLVSWITANSDLLNSLDAENTWENFISDKSPLQESLCYILPRISRSGKQILTIIAKNIDHSNRNNY